MPPKDAKAAAQAAAKKVEDKTFGMKNKNKSKAVQQTIAQMKASAGANEKKRETEDMKKAAARAAMDQVLFKEAKTKKELLAEKMAKAEAAIKKAEKTKEPEKRDIYTDQRDQKKDDLMETWDDDKLRSVVDSKKTAGERVKTSIICKHFIEAVEKRTYGWFWECPNGGDKCQYRHALPEDYVLKRDKDPNAVIDLGPRIEDEIEERRKALTSRTPVTFERLQEWLARKKAKQQEEEEKKLDAAKKQYAKGKASGVSGKMLFSIDASIFVDDANASADKYVRQDDDDEEDQPAVDQAEQRINGDAEPDLNASAPSTEGRAEADDGTSGGAPAAAAIPDLEGVDESLFLDEELPDDVEVS
ncbi:hypothetical protein AB1Y20_010883 [Prymnesium parvum]|uniref:C3H1-type domain-containing protein n=1 Tax=Prymnesium parvum TaxID=97485 RepID=A0AB34IT33_PRYPA